VETQSWQQQLPAASAANSGRGSPFYSLGPMNLESDTPRFAIRCTTYFGWMLPIFVLFSFLAFREHLLFQPLFLALFSLLGVALAIPGAIQVLKLRKKKESKLVTALGSLAGGVGVIALLELKTRGILVWNELYLTVPLLLFMLVTHAACFLAEDKNHLRIYLALDGYHYVRA